MSTTTMTATAPKTRPIPFTAPMVRAILAGTKTQTRRIVPPHWFDGVDAPPIASECPYGKPGDRLYVREPVVLHCGRYGRYAADGDWFRVPPEGLDWYMARVSDGLRTYPPRHVPKWASRIMLEITGVRVERLDDISQVDAMKEGTQGRRSFAVLWDEIHDAGAFGANPWVWCIEFKRINATEVSHA
jgi:hypothetical protein